MVLSIGRLIGAIALLFSVLALHQDAVAETYIQKVENRALKGAAYSRLKGRSYQQCEQACLRDARCVAFEHFRGGGFLRRASNCALYSSIERSVEAKNSDVGFKRRSVAIKKGARPHDRYVPGARTLAPRDREGSAAGQSLPTPRSWRPPAAERSIVERNGEGRGATPPPPVAAAPPPRPTSPSRGLTPQALPEMSSRSIRGVTPSGGAAAPAPAPAPQPAASDKFHIVPVFYGTDRNRVKLETRIGYANDRAKRLEMGRALISVPLDHKVPNIERPRAWTIPYIGTIQLEREDPSKHFTVREIKVLSKEELLALVRARIGASETFRGQSIVFIHGYNMSFDDALYRTAQISYDLQFDGATFAYSWPSGGGLASYIYDRDSAQGAERYLYEFLQMVQNETGSKSINIIAHSMGNQMLLQVLRSLKLRAPDAVARINQVILAAPDVDRDAFEGLAAEIKGVAKGITLYASSNDRALEASRLVAGNKPRAGDVPDGGPVIVSGIDTIDISELATSYFGLHHSGYAEHTDLLTDIGQIFRGGTRPWTARLKAYKPVSISSGTYWRYEN